MHISTDPGAAEAPVERSILHAIVSARLLPLVLGLASAVLLFHVVDGGFQLDDAFQRARLLEEGSRRCSSRASRFSTAACWARRRPRRSRDSSSPSTSRWRRDGRSRWAWSSAACLGLGLAGGEMALGAAGDLVAYAACLERGAPAIRIRSLAPAGIVLAGWASVYALGPFGAEGTDLYLDPLGQPFAFASALLERAPVMIMALWTAFPADLAGSALDTSSRSAVMISSVGVTLAVGLGLHPLLRRDPAARFFALGMILSLVPIASTLP